MRHIEHLEVIIWMKFLGFEDHSCRTIDSLVSYLSSCVFFPFFEESSIPTAYIKYRGGLVFLHIGNNSIELWPRMIFSAVRESCWELVVWQIMDFIQDIMLQPSLLIIIRLAWWEPKSRENIKKLFFPRQFDFSREILLLSYVHLEKTSSWY